MALPQDLIDKLNEMHRHQFYNLPQNLIRVSLETRHEFITQLFDLIQASPYEIINAIVFDNHRLSAETLDFLFDKLSQIGKEIKTLTFYKMPNITQPLMRFLRKKSQIQNLSVVDCELDKNYLESHVLTKENHPLLCNLSISEGFDSETLTKLSLLIGDNFKLNKIKLDGLENEKMLMLASDLFAKKAHTLYPNLNYAISLVDPPVVHHLKKACRENNTFLKLIGVNYDAEIMDLFTDSIFERINLAFSSDLSHFFKNFHQENTLLKLDLSRNPLNDDDAEIIFNTLSRHSALCRLNLSSTFINEPMSKRSAIYLAEMLSKTSLLSLDLSNNKIAHRPMKIISEALENNKYLQMLDLADNKLSDVELKPLLNILNTTQLEGLDLSGNRFGEKTLYRFVEVLEDNKTIKKIDLHVDIEMSAKLAHFFILLLKSNCNILDLSLPEINDEGAKEAIRVFWKNNIYFGSFYCDGISIDEGFHLYERNKAVRPFTQKKAALSIFHKKSTHPLYESKLAALIIKFSDFNKPPISRDNIPSLVSSIILKDYINKQENADVAQQLLAFHKNNDHAQFDLALESLPEGELKNIAIEMQEERNLVGNTLGFN